MRYRVVLLTASVLLAACGSDTTAAESTTSSSAETSTTAEAATTTEATTTTSEATTTTAAALDDVDSNDPVVVAYCEDSLEAERASDEFTSSGAFTDPEAVEAFFAGQLALLEEAVPPSEIDVAFNVVKENFIAFTEAFARIDYDFLNGDTSEIDAIDEDPEAEAANAVLDDFEAMYCPEQPIDEDPGVDLATLTGSEAGRAALATGIASSSGLTEEEALCFVENTPADVLQEYVDFAEGPGGAPSNELISAMLASMDECGLAFEDFL